VLEALIRDLEKVDKIIHLGLIFCPQIISLFQTVDVYVFSLMLCRVLSIIVKYWVGVVFVNGP